MQLPPGNSGGMACMTIQITNIVTVTHQTVWVWPHALTWSVMMFYAHLSGQGLPDCAKFNPDTRVTFTFPVYRILPYTCTHFKSLWYATRPLSHSYWDVCRSVHREFLGTQFHGACSLLRCPFLFHFLLSLSLSLFPLLSRQLGLAETYNRAGSFSTIETQKCQFVP